MSVGVLHLLCCLRHFFGLHFFFWNYRLKDPERFLIVPIPCHLGAAIPVCSCRTLCMYTPDVFVSGLNIKILYTNCFRIYVRYIQGSSAADAYSVVHRNACRFMVALSAVLKATIRLLLFIICFICWKNKNNHSKAEGGEGSGRIRTHSSSSCSNHCFVAQVLG